MSASKMGQFLLNDNIYKVPLFHSFIKLVYPSVRGRPPQELIFMLAIVEKNTTAMVLGGSRIATSGQDLLHYQLRGRSDLLT